MGNYAVFLQGSNFQLDRGAGQQLCGFFMTKRVEASHEQEAGFLAVQQLWLHPDLMGQDKNDPVPHIQVMVVHELPLSIQMKDTRFTVFEMDED